MFGSCGVVSAFVMAQEEKQTVAAWENDDYIIRIQRRHGWAGKPYYQCRVKEKILGGLFKKTIIKETFSMKAYSLCILNYAIYNDTLTIDVCNKTAVKH